VKGGFFDEFPKIFGMRRITLLVDFEFSQNYILKEMRNYQVYQTRKEMNQHLLN
jgi:hypothetical protein